LLYFTEVYFLFACISHPWQRGGITVLRPTFDARLLSFWHNFILTIKERHFAKRIIKHLLKSYAAVSVEKLDLSGKALYREVLLHAQQVEPSRVDQILQQAEESVDEWTAPGRSGLGFREVVHFFVMLKHIEAGHKGAVVSFGEIVDTLIPAHL
jgi:hypothetical protein